jgi:hypothetical protein
MMKRAVFNFATRWPLLGLLWLGMTVGAEPFKGVSDPTRPPPGVMRQQDAGAAASPGNPGAGVNGAAAAASAASAAEPPLPALLLNAIRFDNASGIGMALLNGVSVMAGDKVAGRTVVAIERDAVLLKGPGGTQRLTLLPELDTTRPIKARAAARGRKERK